MNTIRHLYLRLEQELKEHPSRGDMTIEILDQDGYVHELDDLEWDEENDQYFIQVQPAEEISGE